VTGWWRQAACAAGIAAAIVLAATPASQARASTAASTYWLVKSNDLALLQSAGVTNLPAFTWTGCGGLSDPDPCTTGQQPIETSGRPILTMAKDGYSGTVIYDIETWSYTPAPQREHPLDWICRVAKAVKTDKNMRVIITPYAKSPTQMEAEDAEAAKCGAYGVDIQSQFDNAHPYSFRGFVTADVRGIRRQSKSAIILAGLATNNPTPQKASNLARDYRYARAAGAQGFWFNAAAWTPDRCTASEGGTGCPEVAYWFFKDIGLSS
jgi:hypothetical protein